MKQRFMSYLNATCLILFVAMGGCASVKPTSYSTEDMRDVRQWAHELAKGEITRENFDDLCGGMDASRGSSEPTADLRVRVTWAGNLEELCCEGDHGECSNEPYYQIWLYDDTDGPICSLCPEHFRQYVRVKQ